jgi:hypothetical protein
MRKIQKHITSLSRYKILWEEIYEELRGLENGCRKEEESL